MQVVTLQSSIAAAVGTTAAAVQVEVTRSIATGVYTLTQQVGQHEGTGCALCRFLVDACSTVLLSVDRSFTVLVLEAHVQADQTQRTNYGDGRSPD